MASFAGSFLIKVFILHIGFELKKKNHAQIALFLQSEPLGSALLC